MKVIHQDLGNIQNVSAKIDGFVQLQLSFLHVDCNEILTEDRVLVEVGFYR